MLWLQIKYANIIGSQLSKFKIVNSSRYVANFQCPFCDDILEKKRARGYLLEKGNKIISYCHNCGASMPFWIFLSKIDNHIWREYKLEHIQQKFNYNPPKVYQFSQPNFAIKPKQINIGNPLSENSINYLLNRRIPNKFYDSLYENDIIKLVSQIDRYKNSNFLPTSIIAIPFFNKDKQYSYICCRAISDSKFRYITLEVNNLLPKIWGLQFIDWDKPVYCTEGVFDAMMLDNSIALGGATNVSGLRYVDKYIDRKDIICIYDFDMKNNKEVQNQVIKRIDEGYSVFIPYKSIGAKDLNEIISKNILSYQSLEDYIKDRTFNGLKANVELSNFIKRI